MTATAKLVAEMRKAEKAWARLREVEAGFKQAWNAATPTERLTAFARLGIEAAGETTRGDAHDAFTGFGC
jgi:hypothetical protein